MGDRKSEPGRRRREERRKERKESEEGDFRDPTTRCKGFEPREERGERKGW
jgi:hypothetical protein